MVTNYADPSIDDPTGITAGPDGALWFTNSNSGAGSSSGPEIPSGGSPPPGWSPTTPIRASSTRGASPLAPMVPCGSPMATTSIGRITTAGVVTNYTDPSITGADGITAGPDGALWFTDPFNEIIGRVTTGVTGQLLALGDSVAAGYGLGPSGPSTGGSASLNKFAYPALLAGALSLGVENYAIEGSSSGIDNNLGVQAQICQSVGSTATGTGCTGVVTQVSPPPRYITITVGADDIDFAGCMSALLEQGLNTTNPCSSTPQSNQTVSNLQKSLTALKSNLQIDFALLHQYYPNVPIILTGYYNPLGDQAFMPTSCLLVEAATVGPWIMSHNWRALFSYILELYVRQTNNIPGSPVANLYTSTIMSAFAKQILNQLNSTLQGAATGEANVTFTPLDFGTNGICSTNPLVFGPLVNVSWTLTTPFFPDQSANISFGQQNICSGPKDPFENKFTVGPMSGTASLFAGQVLHYSYYTDSELRASSDNRRADFDRKAATSASSPNGVRGPIPSMASAALPSRREDI